jgi:hypothetical protein
MLDQLPDQIFEYIPFVYKTVEKTKSAKKSAYAYYDKWEDDYFYNNGYTYKEWLKEQENKWDKDMYEASMEEAIEEQMSMTKQIDALANAEIENAETKAYYLNEKTDFIQIKDCYLNLADQTIVDLNFNHDYLISQDDRIFHYSGGWIKDAILLDYDFNQLKYRHFLTEDLKSYNEDYVDYERRWMS